MFLKNISINQFKCHEQLNIELIERINVFCGKNGIGKTNILDSVYVLLNGKSYFHTADNLCVKQNENYFLLKGNIYNQNEEIKLQVSFQTGKRKSIKNDDKPIMKYTDFFGKFPCVMIAPDDIEIINGESELRRNFFDYLFSIIDNNYLNHLISYNKALDNRNRQLKIFIEKDNFDEVLIDFFNTQLQKHGKYIYNTRKKLTPVFKEFFDKSYSYISDESDLAQFSYHSALNSMDWSEGFIQNLQKDRILGRTNFGIHRDDWLFELNNMSLKKTGSQGQKKSYLISLKLAMYNLIYEKRQLKPILLLDDIFEKIDNSRIEKLRDIIAQSQTGQVFITDTSSQRINEIFKEIKNLKVTLI